MKNLTLIVLFLALIACNKQTELPDYAIISGKITNSDNSEIPMRGDRYMNFEKSIKLNDDGSFSDTLRLDKWDWNYKIRALKTSVNFHVRKGDHLIINVDTSNTKNPVSFGGSGATINNYLLANNNLKLELVPKKSNINGLDENAFVEKIEELKNAQLELLANTEDLSEKFISQEKKDIEYNYYIKKGQYEFFHGRATKNSDFRASKQLWDSYYAYDFENEEQFNKSFPYQDLVLGRLRNFRTVKARQYKAEGITYSSSILWMNTIVEKTENMGLKEYIMKNNVSRYMKSTMKEEEKIELFDFYMENATVEDFRNEVQKSFDEAKRLWKGSPSPEFVAYRNYAGGTTSLDDLKGKYVYIDVWATWCGPCKFQIPYLKKIEAAYHEKNIEFVSLSIDKQKDEKKWEKMIVDKELTGIQLLADREFQSEFIKAYNITGIPRFILIDPEGNIVTQNAPRPSSDDLKALFNELGI